MAVTNHSKRPVSVALEGEIVSQSRMRLVTTASGEIHGSSVSPDRTLTALSIDQAGIDNIQKIGLYRLLEVAPQLNKCSAFVQLIFRALRVFGRAKTTPIIEDRIVGYIVVLESFLTTSDGPISQRVAEGAVVFLDIPVQKRIDLRAKMLEFYRFRSKIAHGEEIKSPSPEDVWLLEDITKNFLMAMISRADEFASKSGLIEYLERRRLSWAERLHPWPCSHLGEMPSYAPAKRRSGKFATKSGMRLARCGEGII